MTEREKIEEAHGLWELAVVRLAALAEAGASKDKLRMAVENERSAFCHWQFVSRKAVS